MPPHLTDAPNSDGLLDRAVREGIISDAQRERLVALSREHRQPAPTRTERAPLILVAYTAGSAAVLFAFGWFLVERWRALGPGGVLVVVALYAAIFAATSWWLAREGFPLASSFAALLAVGMTPIATWSILNLTGFWQGAPPDVDPSAVPVSAWVRPPTRWAIVELATALAALVTYRFTRFAPLALPVAIAAWLAPLHLATPFLDPFIVPALFGWGSFVTGTLLLFAATALERRQVGGDTAGGGMAFDPLVWIYPVVVAALFAGVVATWDDSLVVRHGVLALSVASAVMALSLGRRLLLAASGIAFVAYLAYLAFDVFERVLSFPVVLATFGIAIILLTVAAQRRWPALAGRLATARAGARRLPGGYAIPGALVTTAVILALMAPPKAYEGIWRRHREQLEAIRKAGEWRRREAAAGRPVRRMPPGYPPPERPESRPAETPFPQTP